MAPPASLPSLVAESIGDLVASTLGVSSGGISPPTTALAQPSLPGTTTTRPVPAALSTPVALTDTALSTPVTLTDAARSASQTSKAARQTKAPSPISSSAHMAQTQSAIGPPSPPTASSLPSASTSAPSQSFHWLAPMLGVICVLGVVSLATASILKYSRRRREGARKIREGQRAISFINQLSQYDKPSADEKKYGGTRASSPADEDNIYTQGTKASKLPDYCSDDNPTSTSQHDHPLADHYQVAQLTYANHTYHGQNGQLEMRVSPTGMRFIPSGSSTQPHHQVTEPSNHPIDISALSMPTPPITSLMLASAQPQEFSHDGEYTPQPNTSLVASDSGFARHFSNSLLGPASYESSWPQTPSFSSSNAGISPVLFATRQPDGLAYFSPAQSQSQGIRFDDENESQSHHKNDLGRSRSDTENSHDMSTEEGEFHTLEYREGVGELGSQENDWPTSVCHHAFTSEGDDEGQRVPQADSPFHGAPRLSYQPDTLSLTSPLYSGSAKVQDSSTDDDSVTVQDSSADDDSATLQEVRSPIDPTARLSPTAIEDLRT